MQLRAIHLDLKVDQEVEKVAQKLVIQVVDGVDLEVAEEEGKGK